MRNGWRSCFPGARRAKSADRSTRNCRRVCTGSCRSGEHTSSAWRRWRHGSRSWRDGTPHWPWRTAACGRQALRGRNRRRGCAIPATEALAQAPQSRFKGRPVLGQCICQCGRPSRPCNAARYRARSRPRGLRLPPPSRGTPARYPLFRRVSPVCRWRCPSQQQAQRGRPPLLQQRRLPQVPPRRQQRPLRARRARHRQQRHGGQRIRRRCR